MKNKIFIFTGGLIAGLVIGVLFSVAIKELLIQFKGLHISLNKISLKQSELSQRLDSIQGKLIPDNKKAVTPTTQTNTKPVAQNTLQQAAIKSQDDKVNRTSVSNSSAGDSDIVVMTNQLILETSASLVNKDTLKRNIKTEKMDSAIAALSDVSEAKEPQEYKIEFWKSPLNYKGYKMSRNKIVIYGLQPAGGIIDILKYNGNYYLINGMTSYKLEYTDDYKPLEQITEKEISKN